MKNLYMIETLEDAVYQNIGLASNQQGIINQALATSNVMKLLQKRMYSEEEVYDIIIRLFENHASNRTDAAVDDFDENLKKK